MKKHKNILSEVTHIKHLMGLREYSHDDCEDQLEKHGYIVFSPSEQKTRDVGCENKTKLMCVKNWLVSKGIDETEINIKKHSNNNCYLIHSVGNVDLDGKEYPNQSWVFWANGRVALIDTFSELKFDESHEKYYAQYQYDGKYECNGGSLRWKDLNYSGVYSFDNKMKLITSFPGKDWGIPNTDDGSGNKIKIGKLLNTNSSFTKNNFMI